MGALWLTMQELVGVCQEVRDVKTVGQRRHSLDLGDVKALDGLEGVAGIHVVEEQLHGLQGHMLQALAELQVLLLCNRHSSKHSQQALEASGSPPCETYYTVASVSNLAAMAQRSLTA